ncbi:thiamine biosynthesis protein [Corynebacterium humireducens NBRC 106098 = DSM 45392]|uniref:Thiamine biosynthesis protein n=1 Tax=Corynebacterium humireducens NBRC 106098 = DSM 45392 TaxID=1223515 RepID=A0A0B5D6D0_9CORY|nr:hypothetical protein [Corynebacterium humireducens]AJE32727.1 thiamine biosynthesis protein [Corynebacterium humireducens NBRC 106098 = DSM 45392]
MNRIFARKGAAVVGAAALALALAACSPPNEQPSDLKVDTATEFQAPAAENGTATTTTTTTTEVTEVEDTTTVIQDGVVVEEAPVQN